MSNNEETPVNETGSKRSNFVRDTLMAELQALRNISFECITNMKTAKTSAKKDYFLKKLKKNNVRLADCLMMLDRLPSSHVDETQPVSETNEVKEDETITS